MDKSTVRVRPLRFAFLVNHQNKESLQQAFELNSSLWGGVYNFILPLFKKVPSRYRQRYQKPISASTMLKGLAEAFQPDFLVESEPGQTRSFGIDFPPARILPIQDLLYRDTEGRCKLGVDLRSVCNDLYAELFRFEQRHPPEVSIPVSRDKRYQLLFDATFGTLPQSGVLSEVSNIYLNSLGGKREVIDPLDFPKLFDRKHLFPLRVTAHKLETLTNSWSIDSKLFYMDETSPLDLIEFWNLRALGWSINPLPSSLAPKLIDYCESFVEQAYKPYPPPSNAFHHASFMCAPSRSFDEMKEFVSRLKRSPQNAITIDPRVPRIWEEWGRSADHAEAQTIVHSKQSVDTQVIGQGLHLSVELHDFADHDRYCSRSLSCANVLETVAGSKAVIPWKSNVASALTEDFGEESTWISREGIVIFAGYFSRFPYLRVPSALNIFSSLAQSVGYELTLSPAGKTCQQIIEALGGLPMLGTVTSSPDLLRFIDRLAHEDIEVEIKSEEKGVIKRRNVAKSYAPLASVLQAVRRANPDNKRARSSHLNALTKQNVLKLGMALPCPNCSHSSWFSLESLSSKMPCPRCLAEFEFPAGYPPDKEAWAYRVMGPFAATNFAQGAYCVASALNFLTDKIAHESTWLPSFDIRNEDGKHYEADFAMFAAPNRFSHGSSPYLVIGECKSFNRFAPKDFARARHAAILFPGAVLCFCTFNEALNPLEIKAIGRLAIRGRKKMDIGKQMNPVLVLTGRELFGQYKLGSLYALYGDREQQARNVFVRGDIQELCDFTQQVYLKLPSYSTWLEENRLKRLARQNASKKKRRGSGSADAIDTLTNVINSK